MDYDKLTYRFLESNELDIFLDLHNSSDMWMGHKKNPEHVDAYTEYRKKLFLAPNNRTAGAFDSENKLVATTAGWFPEEVPYWYTHGQVHDISNRSLSNGVDSWMVLLKLMTLLYQHGESNNFFSFYNYRSVKHQQTIEKIQKIVADKGLFSHRYDAYWECIYSPGDTRVYKNHKFYSPTALNSSGQDNVVVLYTLKQDLRLPILRNKISN